MKEKIKYDRKYLGITITGANYREIMNAAIADNKNPRHEINYHTRHLEAYIKGQDKFRHGWRVNKDGEVTGPAYFKIMQELTIKS